MRAALARQADAQRASHMRFPLPPLLVLLLALAAGLPAQNAAQQPNAPPAPAAADKQAAAIPPKLRARTLADLTALPGELAKQPYAFTGTAALRCDLAAESPDYTFAGARDGELDLLRLAPWTVLTHGDRQLQQKDGGGWTVPQGDAPDCPLALHRLAHHLATADLLAVSAATFDDRPAMRLHLRWTSGDAARRLADEIVLPYSGTQQMIEGAARVLQRAPAERWVLDAALWYDPANKNLLATTLRLALLQPKPRPADVVEPTPPTGLPLLAHDCALELVLTLTRRPAAELPIPALTPAQRAQLALPPRPQSAAAGEAR